jgi:hypothetical protein
MNIRTQDKRVFVYDNTNPPSFLFAENVEAHGHEKMIGGNLSAIANNSSNEHRNTSRSKKSKKNTHKNTNKIDNRVSKDSDPRNLTLT